MNTPPLTPGTQVDVTIRGAEIVATWPDGQIEVAYGTGQHRAEACVTITDPSVTITPAAVTPQPGQVWEHPELGYRHILPSRSGQLWAKSPDASVDVPVGDVDWSGARCVYPPVGEPTLAAYRRVLVDGGGRVWAETAPNAEEYLCGVGNSDPARTRAWIQQTYRVARDFTLAEAIRHTAPPTAGVQAEDNAAGSGEVLRRFDDGEGEVWTEVEPGSDRYCPSCRGGTKCHFGGETREYAATHYGPLRDLPPVPAAATDGGAA